jgi:hypothetical protein
VRPRNGSLPAPCGYLNRPRRVQLDRTGRPSAPATTAWARLRYPLGYPQPIRVAFSIADLAALLGTESRT